MFTKNLATPDQTDHKLYLSREVYHNGFVEYPATLDNPQIGKQLGNIVNINNNKKKTTATNENTPGIPVFTSTVTIASLILKLITTCSWIHVVVLVHHQAVVEVTKFTVNFRMPWV